MRQRITRTLAGVLIALSLIPCALAQAPKPNILFILVDDMGWGDLGVFYQNSRDFAVNRNKPAFATPKLDTLAAEGLQLRRHYCPSPVCAPSRASLLLGVHQGHANVRDNQFDKALENNHTLASVLRQAGYTTALIGKYGLQGPGIAVDQPGHPLRRGFDYFYGMLAHLSGHYHYPKEESGTDNQGQPTGVHENYTNVTTGLDRCYSTDLFTARAKRWLMDHQATNTAQPFFMYLGLTAPHARLDVPTQAYPAGSGTNGGLQWLGSAGGMINTASGSINSWIHPDYTNATYDHDNNAGTTEIAWPDYAKRHATMMRRIDDAVADLIRTLKDLNCDTNTLVVFTSDNGPHNENGNGGAYTYNPTFFDSFGPMDGIKRDTWEGGMRVPAIVRWPGHVAAGATNFTASQFHDWLPTFAEFAGLPSPARSDGVSLVPTLTGVGAQRPSTIYIEYYVAGTTPTYTEFESSRRGATRNQEQIIHLDGYKGIRYNISSSTDNFKIYDTLNDPKETTDLAAISSYFTSLQQRMQDRVLQVCRPNSSAPRPYDLALVPPVSSSNLVTGVDYRAFEGSYLWVPDFTTITSATNGICTGIDLSVRTRNDNIGLLFTGYLDVPSDGTYTIYLTTDSRAFLRLHDASVIDADFAYAGGTEVSASINLKAGCHPLKLGYVRGTNGAPSLALQWSGPGISKQAIPSASLVHVNTGTTTAANDSANTTQNTAVTINVLANDAPGSGPGPLRIVSWTTPANGSVTTNLMDQFVYTPNASFLGVDTFNYTITDGLSDATGTVSVTVVAAVPPTAGDDAASTKQNTAVTINALANDAAGSGSGPLRVLDISAPASGTAVTNVSGQILYTPNPGFLGDDTFTYTITDGTSTATATVRMKVFFADGLIWFPFNQTSGMTTEDAGGAFTGNLNGFTDDPAQWVAGKWNRAIDFNGGSYVAISGFNGILGASNRTVTAWVKTTSTGSGVTGQPVIAWGPNTTGNKWIFLVNGGHARIEITSGYLEGTTLVNDGQWHHIACVYSNNLTSITNAKLYVDGILETTFTAQLSLAVNTTSSGNVMIGSDLVSQQTRYFNGLIDEPRIYDRALPAAEIAALYSATNQSAAAWHRRYFGGAPVVWTADDDGDGGARLLEYAFGGQPWVADRAALSIVGALMGNRLQITFPRRLAGTSELVYSPEASPNLAAWDPLGVSFVGASPIAALPGFEATTFQSTSAVSQSAAQFIRVSVALSDN